MQILGQDGLDGLSVSRLADEVQASASPRSTGTSRTRTTLRQVCQQILPGDGTAGRPDHGTGPEYGCETVKHLPAHPPPAPQRHPRHAALRAQTPDPRDLERYVVHAHRTGAYAAHWVEPVVEAFDAHAHGFGRHALRPDERC